MKTGRHSSRDRDRYTATQDVPLLSLCNCLPNAHISGKKELKGDIQTLQHFHQAACFHLMMMHYDQLTVCSSSLSLARKQPISSQMEHFIWSFIFWFFSYYLSHIQWNSCHFIAAGGIKSHSCIYKLAFFPFHFLVRSLKIDRVKEHFIFAKTKLNNCIWDDSEVRCFESGKHISTQSSTFRVRDTHT